MIKMGEFDPKSNLLNLQLVPVLQFVGKKSISWKVEKWERRL